MLSSSHTSNLKPKLKAIEDDLQDFQFEDAITKLNNLKESNLTLSAELLNLIDKITVNFKPERQTNGVKRLESAVKYISYLKQIIFTLFEKLSKNTKEEVIDYFRDYVIYYLTKYQYASCDKDKIAYHKTYVQLLEITYKLAELCSLKIYSSLKLEFEGPFIDKAQVLEDLHNDIPILLPNHDIPVAYYDPVLFLKMHRILDVHLSKLESMPRYIDVRDQYDENFTYLTFGLALVTSTFAIPSTIYTYLSSYNGPLWCFTATLDWVAVLAWVANCLCNLTSDQVANKYSADFSELKSLFHTFVAELEIYEDLVKSTTLYHPCQEFSLAKQISDEIVRIKESVTNAFTLLENKEASIVAAADVLLKNLKHIVTINYDLPKICQRYLLFTKKPIEKPGEYNLSKLFQM